MKIFNSYLEEEIASVLSTSYFKPNDNLFEIIDIIEDNYASYREQKLFEIHQNDNLVKLTSEVDKLALDIEGASKNNWDLYEFESVKLALEEVDIPNYLKELILNSVAEELDTVNVSDLFKEIAQPNQEIEITFNHPEYGSNSYTINL
jgi:hypothetical protein